MNAIAPDDPPIPEDHAYFLAIERSFLALRRKAALLTAADWQEAQDWHRQGIPVELIQNVMERLFERQAAGKGRTISGLRYFRAAVETAWEEMLALKAGGRAEEACRCPRGPGSRTSPRGCRRRCRIGRDWVAALAATPANAAPGGAGDPATGLAQGASAEEVEVALRDLDAQLLSTLRAGLDAEQRRRTGR